MSSSPASLIANPWRRIRAFLGLMLVGGLFAFSCAPRITYDEDLGSDLNLGGSSSGGNGLGGATGDDLCDNGNLDVGETDQDCGGKKCGGCRVGETCKVSADCLGDSCIDDVCRATCGDNIKNGDNTVDSDPETDVDCGGTVCPGCGTGKSCIGDSDCSSRYCKDRVCVEPTCEDNRHNGEESDVDCGGACPDSCLPGQMCTDRDDCLQPPETDPSTTICSDSTEEPDTKECTLSCVAGFEDCDRTTTNGCETNIGADPDNCGNCRNICDLDNVAANKCEAGSCTINFEAEEGGCESGFLDVNGDADDGCEVDPLTDPLHCGGRDFVCSSNNGAAGCSSGLCTIACDQGFDDCDEDPGSNGCEINTDTNVAHCGVCNNDCPAGVGESAFCDTSKSPSCQTAMCEPTDCDGDPCGDCDGMDGCSDYLDTVDNCGGCGVTCEATNATATCSAPGGAAPCSIDDCVDSGDAKFANCDGEFSNGCEIDTETNIDNCGACSSVDDNNSCSASLGEDAITAVNCNSGDCEVVSCEIDWKDCNGLFDDGCEANTTSLSHCGACDNACASKPHSTASCNAGTACLWICDDAWVDADDDLQTGTNGCEVLDLVYVSPTVTRGVSTRTTALSFTHNLLTGSGKYRLLVVAVGSQQNPDQNSGFPTSVTYDGTDAIRVDGVFENFASTSFWLLYDSDLGSAGEKEVVVTPKDVWGAFYAEVHEFSGAKQYSTPTNVPSTSIALPGNCLATLKSTSMDTSAGSFLFGITASQAPTANVKAHPADYTTPGGVLSTELIDLVAASPTNSLQIASAHSGPLSAGTNEAGFIQTGCWGTALSLIEIEAGP